MNWFQNLMVRTKVVAAFALVLVVTIVLGVFAITRISLVHDGAVLISDNYLVASNALANVAQNTMRYRQLQAAHILAATPEKKSKEAASMQDVLGDVSKEWSTYAPTVDAGKESELAGRIQPLWQAYLALDDQFLTLSRANKTSDATKLYTGDMRTAFHSFKDALQADLDFQKSAGASEAAEVRSTYDTAWDLIVAVLTLAGLLCLTAGWTIVSGVSTPIRRMTDAMQRLAAHDLSIQIEGVARKDEIGQMAAAVQVFKDSMAETDRLKAEQEKVQHATESRAKYLDELTRDFEAKVASVVQAVASQATQMQSSALSMSATAEEATKQASAVAAASEKSSTNVQTVAAATEELSSSIAEISRQVSHSSQIAANAVTEAGKANDMVQGLVGASQKIGEIVALINDIADQTNLLALNATIEAARAGEAGKGFAVVAAEVKNLATQTSKATEEIGAQITNVQGATQNAVQAIASIGKTIGEIDQISTTIAAAVEEQGAATQEIARNVEEAAKGSQEVSSNIGGVTEAANGTGTAANQVLVVARELVEQSGTLKGVVQQFLTHVKAA